MSFSWKRFIENLYLDLPIVPKDCTGQTFIVTGANTGLGIEAARHFVRLNASKVILACRSLSKGDAAKQSIERSTGRTGVAEVWHLDLGNYDTIRAFATKAATQLDRIDAICENAGIAMASWTEIDGVESSMKVNVYGTFLLAMLLLPKMREGAKKYGITPRLTVVTSGTGLRAQFVEGQADNVFEACEKRDDKAAEERYPVSKLIQIFAIRGMAADLPVNKSHIIFNVLSPGFCVTELNRNVGWQQWAAITILRLFFSRTAEHGSRTILHAAVAGEEFHGHYLGDCTDQENRTAISQHLKSKELQEKVWTQLKAKLEQIEPGVVTRAYNTN